MGSRWFSALLAAAAGAIGLLWTWAIAFSDWGVRTDQRLYVELAERRPAGATQVAIDATQFGNPGWFSLLVVLVLAVPLVRRRWAVLAAVAILIVGANLTTQVLQELTFGDRHVLLQPRAYWPSGHTTAVLSVGLGLAIGVPRWLRLPAAVVAVAGTVVMGWALVVVATHLPSDVIAAVFVCGIWGSLVVAGLLALADQRAAAQASS